ncbi:MAG: hypothetical protein R6V77_05275 [Candidatus Cloacimonadaceae bacterium]
MNSFKALVIKDLQANRKILMVPVWYLLGTYVFMAGSIVFATTTGAKNMTISGIPLDLLTNDNLHQMMSFLMQSAAFFGFLGIIFVIAMSIIGSSLLNQDIKHKCELFHRSQPVSVWKITASRFIAGIGGLIALALAIGVLNMFLSNFLAMMLTPMRVNWWMSFNGLILSWLHFSIAIMVLGSILFTLSAIFKDNAFGLGAACLGGLQLVTLFLNKIYGWNIPYIANAIFKLIMSGILKIQAYLPTSQQFGIVTIRTGSQEPDLSTFVVPPNFLTSIWSSLFTWDIAFKFFFCAVMFVIATLIYKRREVQF